MVEADRVTHFVAGGVLPRGFGVVLAIALVEEGVVELDRDRLDVVTGIVEVEPGQPQPALLRAIAPATNFDFPAVRVAVLRARASGDLLDGDGAALVPVGDRIAKQVVPLTVNVVAGHDGEFKWFAGPVIILG